MASVSGSVNLVSFLGSGLQHRAVFVKPWASHQAPSMAVEAKARTRGDDRAARHSRIRKQVTGAIERPGLCVFRSNKHLYVQVTDDTKMHTIASASTTQNPLSEEFDYTAGPTIQDKAGTKYYFVVANAKFMLDEEEHFQELLFERLRNYGERNKEQDFWLVVEPKFLENFPNLTKRLGRPAVALVSTNGPWITFMKLRLDRVLSDCYEATSLDEALASNPATLEFGQPEKWSAPYPKYEFGWWEPFLPKGIQESKV